MVLTPLPFPVRYRIDVETWGPGWEYVAALTPTVGIDGDAAVETLGLCTFYGTTFMPCLEAASIVEAFIGDEWIRVVGEHL